MDLSDLSQAFPDIGSVHQIPNDLHNFPNRPNPDDYSILPDMPACRRYNIYAGIIIIWTLSLVAFGYCSNAKQETDYKGNYITALEKTKNGKQLNQIDLGKLLETK